MLKSPVVIATPALTPKVELRIGLPLKLGGTVPTYNEVPSNKPGILAKAAVVSIILPEESTAKLLATVPVNVPAP